MVSAVDVEPCMVHNGRADVFPEGSHRGSGSTLTMLCTYEMRHKRKQRRKQKTSDRARRQMKGKAKRRKKR